MYDLLFRTFASFKSPTLESLIKDQAYERIRGHLNEFKFNHKKPALALGWLCLRLYNEIQWCKNTPERSAKIMCGYTQGILTLLKEHKHIRKTYRALCDDLINEAPFYDHELSVQFLAQITAFYQTRLAMQQYLPWFVRYCRCIIDTREKAALPDLIRLMQKILTPKLEGQYRLYLCTLFCELLWAFYEFDILYTEEEKLASMLAVCRGFELNMADINWQLYRLSANVATDRAEVIHFFQQAIVWHEQLKTPELPSEKFIHYRHYITLLLDCLHLLAGTKNHAARDEYNTKIRINYMSLRQVFENGDGLGHAVLCNGFMRLVTMKNAFFASEEKRYTAFALLHFKRCDKKLLNRDLIALWLPKVCRDMENAHTVMHDIELYAQAIALICHERHFLENFATYIHLILWLHQKGRKAFAIDLLQRVQHWDLFAGTHQEIPYLIKQDCLTLEVALRQSCVRDIDVGAYRARRYALLQKIVALSDNPRTIHVFTCELMAPKANRLVLLAQFNQRTLLDRLTSVDALSLFLQLHILNFESSQSTHMACAFGDLTRLVHSVHWKNGYCCFPQKRYFIYDNILNLVVKLLLHNAPLISIMGMIKALGEKLDHEGDGFTLTNALRECAFLLANWVYRDGEPLPAIEFKATVLNIYGDYLRATGSPAQFLKIILSAAKYAEHHEDRCFSQYCYRLAEHELGGAQLKPQLVESLQSMISQGLARTSEAASEGPPTAQLGPKP